MNPIMRNLYAKAVNNFHKVPQERQNSLMQLVQDIERAAQMGDRQRVDSFSSKLAQLLDGI